jgi:hypothetical protein
LVDKEDLIIIPEFSFCQLFPGPGPACPFRPRQIVFSGDMPITCSEAWAPAKP